MLGPQLVELFGRIRRYELIGKGVSLAAYFEVSKAHIIPVSVHTLICSPLPPPLPSSLRPSLHYMLLQHYACLLAAKTLTLCNHEHNCEPQIKHCFRRSLGYGVLTQQQNSN